MPQTSLRACQKDRNIPDMGWSDIISNSESARTLIAAAGSIPAQEMVDLIDYAILNTFVLNGESLVSMSIAGKSHSVNLTAAQQLRDYYRKRAIDEANDDSEVYGQTAGLYDV